MWIILILTASSKCYFGTHCVTNARPRTRVGPNFSPWRNRPSPNPWRVPWAWYKKASLAQGLLSLHSLFQKLYLHQDFLPDCTGKWNQNALPPAESKDQDPVRQELRRDSREESLRGLAWPRGPEPHTIQMAMQLSCQRATRDIPGVCENSWGVEKRGKWAPGTTEIASLWQLSQERHSRGSERTGAWRRPPRTPRFPEPGAGRVYSAWSTLFTQAPGCEAAFSSGSENGNCCCLWSLRERHQGLVPDFSHSHEKKFV